jgi:DNA/RNA-binding domain of Phe-tRNA-synthetase-like protein
MRLGKNDELEFEVSDSVKELGIKGAYFVLDFEPRKAKADDIAALKNTTIQQIRNSQTSVHDDSILRGFRDLHKTVGVSNRKHVSSPENLIELILRGRDLPNINPIVDIYNIVSLQTRLALGAHDTDALVGPIKLKLTDGTESFTPLGSHSKAIGAGEYGYVDTASNEVICRLETRQCEKTKVSDSTRSCFFIVEGNRNTSAAYVRETVSKLQALLVAYSGASETEKVYWLT